MHLEQISGGVQSNQQSYKVCLETWLGKSRERLVTFKSSFQQKENISYYKKSFYEFPNRNYTERLLKVTITFWFNIHFKVILESSIHNFRYHERKKYHPTILWKGMIEGRTDTMLSGPCGLTQLWAEDSDLLCPWTILEIPWDFGRMHRKIKVILTPKYSLLNWELT